MRHMFRGIETIQDEDLRESHIPTVILRQQKVVDRPRALARRRRVSQGERIA